MKITIDTNEPLSSHDRQILLLVLSAEVAEHLAQQDISWQEGGDLPDTSAEPSPSLDDAVKLANELVDAGKTDLIKEALSTVGAKRVSEMTPAQVTAFVAYVS